MSDSVPADVLLVHPTDVDLPLVKSVAAEYGIDVVASENVPVGRMFRAAGYLRNYLGGPDANP